MDCGALYPFRGTDCTGGITMKQAEGMLAQIRRKSIVELVDAQGFVTVSELCERFSVSPATIRNDLHELEADQHIERTHGGAISCRRAVYEPDADQKSVQQVREKEQIAQAALKYIQPGDVIALDTGTTTYALARRLGGFERLTVVTCDLQIAAWLESNTNVRIIMAGGQVRRSFHCTCGQTAIDTLSRLHVDKLFIAANAVSLDGLSTPSLEMAAVKSTLIASADRVILLADSTKLKRRSFARFAGLEQVHALITDRCADPTWIAQLVERGVEVEQV